VIGVTAVATPVADGEIAGKGEPVEGNMATALITSLRPPGSRGVSALLKGALLGALTAVLFVSTLTLGASPAAAVDINGLVNAAMAISARYVRVPSSHGASNTTAKRDRDSDDSEDEDSGSRNRKSAGTPSQPQHRPAATMRKSMEAAAADPAESMVSLDRSLDDRSR
jgi:hypothetical protein